MIEALKAWCEKRPEVTAALLTGSRARRGAVVDDLSDWDVALFLPDPAALLNEEWYRDFGDVLVCLPTTQEQLGQTISARLVQYVDGTRIDFALFPADLLRVIAYLPDLPPWIDAGYEVLYDPGNVTGSMVPPYGRGYAGRPPTPDEVRADIEEFWWEAIIVSRELVRGEALAAAYSAEAVMRHGLLRRMLEWRAGVETGWAHPGGPFGRRVAPVPSDLIDRSKALATSWAGGEGWDELTRLMDVFADVARGVAANVGAEYPEEVEQRARAMIAGRRSALD